MNFFLKNILFPCLFVLLTVGSLHAADIPQDVDSDTASLSGQVYMDGGILKRANLQRGVQADAADPEEGRPARGCGNVPRNNVPRNNAPAGGGCAGPPAAPSTNNADTDTNTDSGADADSGAGGNSGEDGEYSDFAGTYNLTGMFYDMGGNSINAGSFMGTLGVDWFGQVIVTADGHIEVDFTMPPMAAQIAGQRSLDILSATNDVIQVSMEGCEKDYDQVIYYVDGSSVAVTVDVEAFCKAAVPPRSNPTTFHFQKVAGPGSDADGGTAPGGAPGTTPGTGTGTAGNTRAEPAVYVPVEATSPITLQSPCMINSLMQSN